VKQGKKTIVVSEDDHRRPEDDDGNAGEIAASFKKMDCDGGKRQRDCGWRSARGGDARKKIREGARIESGRTQSCRGSGGSGSEHHGDWAVPSSAEGAETAGLTLEQMDRVEVNEAFAAQYLAVEKVLG